MVYSAAQVDAGRPDRLTLECTLIPEDDARVASSVFSATGRNVHCLIQSDSQQEAS
jgi:hypothetical protein